MTWRRQSSSGGADFAGAEAVAVTRRRGLAGGCATEHGGEGGVANGQAEVALVGARSQPAAA
jgi:hypothetical protein